MNRLRLAVTAVCSVRVVLVLAIPTPAAIAIAIAVGIVVGLGDVLLAIEGLPRRQGAPVCHLWDCIGIAGFATWNLDDRFVELD